MKDPDRIDARQVLPDQIARHITDRLVGRSNAGDKLPIEPELAAMFGVSRPTIREAVKILVARNMVEVVRGKGTFVSARPGLVKDPLGIRFIRDDGLLLHLQETRLLLEPGAAALAARRSCAGELKRLRRIVERMIETTGQDRLDMEDELLFHTSVAEATHNPVIQRLIPLLAESITGTYMATRESYSEHRKAALAHRKVLEAMEARDSAGARETMRRHLEESLRDLRRAWNRNRRAAESTSAEQESESKEQG